MQKQISHQANVQTFCHKASVQLKFQAVQKQYKKTLQQLLL